VFPWHIAAAVATAAVLAAGLYGFGYRAGHDRATATEKAQELRLQELAAKVTASTAESIAGIRVVNQTVSGKVREVVRENTVYRDCAVDPYLQRLLDSARQGRAEPPADSGSLPAAGLGPAP
jgi:hypothetical protein